MHRHSGIRRWVAASVVVLTAAVGIATDSTQPVNASTRLAPHTD